MRPEFKLVPYITLKSETAIGISSRAGSMPPVSKNTTAFGAYILLAAVAASIDTPVPAKTISPSLMNLPAQIDIISLSVYLVAIYLYLLFT